MKIFEKFDYFFLNLVRFYNLLLQYILFVENINIV